MGKFFLIFIVITTALILVPNPLQYKFPNLIQTYVNFQNKSNKGVLDINELEIAQQNPVRCAQNSDCTIIPCGKAPNCHSIAINKEFYSENQANLPSDFICPVLTPQEDTCEDTYFLDMYAACEEKVCILKRFFNSD